MADCARQHRTAGGGGWWGRRRAHGHRGV